MDRILAAQPLKVPTMLVDSLWDQEDIYGAPALYKALKAKDTANDKVFLVLGPWHHGQEIGDGSTLGALKFNSDTGLYFRTQILRPFLDHYLKDGAPADNVAPVIAFETGTNAWRRLPAWPAGCAGGCTIKSTAALPGGGSKAGFRSTESRGCGLRRICFRSRQARPLSPTSESAGGLRQRPDLAAVAGG